MLEFDHVTFQYQNAGQPILKDLSFTVPKGSFTALTGASGSGKTTIFRLLNGLEQPSKGKISWNGTEIQRGFHTAAYMPQQDLLFPWFSVLENVMLPLTVQKVPYEIRKEKAMQALTQAGLGSWADKNPAELSGGMKQRAAFARTLCVGSDLLLLDEPFSALDAITRMEMQEWLRDQWKSLSKTILFITHDVEEAIFLSQTILVLEGKPVTKAAEYSVHFPETADPSHLDPQRKNEIRESILSHLRKDRQELG